MEFIKVGATYFRIDSFAKFMEMMETLGTDTITLEKDSDRKFITAESCNGWAILVPNMKPVNDEVIIYDLTK